MFTKCVLSILEVNLNQRLRDKKFVIICSRCPHNCKTAHFTSWKTPEGLWDVQKWKMHVRHMQNYQFSLSNMQICDVLSLSWMLSSQILNTVAKHITSKNKRNVECCGRRCWMEIKLCSILSNSVWSDGQTDATCSIQRYWMMLNQHVESLCPGLLR